MFFKWKKIKYIGLLLCTHVCMYVCIIQCAVASKVSISMDSKYITVLYICVHLNCAIDSPTCSVSTSKVTPNLYFLSEVRTYYIPELVDIVYMS